MAASLAPEILRMIFVQCRELHGLVALIPSLTVCKSWSYAAIPMLWANVVLGNRSLQPFLENLSEQHSLHTRSLTLRIYKLEIDLDSKSPVHQRYTRRSNPGTTALWNHLRRLADLVNQSMPRLKMFSHGCKGWDSM